MDLSRRGFMAAVTSTLATAVPVATALTVRPMPKLEPETVDFEYIPPEKPVEQHFGLCADCESWNTDHFGARNRTNKINRNGRKEGYCEATPSEMGITRSYFGCVLFEERRPINRAAGGLNEMEIDYHSRLYIENLSPKE